jgi:hypothetical protein
MYYAYLQEWGAIYPVLMAVCVFNASRAYLLDLPGESGPISPWGFINEGICQNNYHNYLRQSQSLDKLKVKSTKTSDFIKITWVEHYTKKLLNSR